MTNEQCDLITNYIEKAHEFAIHARLPVSPFVDAVEACLIECRRLRADEHKRHWGQWEAAQAWNQQKEERRFGKGCFEELPFDGQGETQGDSH